MPTNDPILLDQILKQRKAELAPDVSASEFFELFVSEELLKDRSLSYDELSSGLVGGGNDGGVDGIWTFVNGELVQEDSKLSGLKKNNIELELVIQQAKRTNGYGEEPINKLIAITENLLDLSKPTSDYRDRYSTDVIAAADLFRKTYQDLAGRFPALRIRYYYVSVGSDVHPNTQAKANDLKSKVPALFSEAETSFDFVGASDLVALARQKPKTSFNLMLAESPISSSGAVAYICLVKLKDWFDFITTDSSEIREELFEANVRDYQGATQVNREIQLSLKGDGPEDFWWLNNGISVLAGQATQSAKSLTIEDPQIVNGLQTSRQIYEFFSANESDTEDPRLVLVRVIVPDAEESRDKIIKATNSQTHIPPASLKATDKIQRDIEEFLKPRGIYYDRRKNLYKNQGKAVADIVSIGKMAQALMSICLARPDDARARPSSLLKSETDYANLFSEDHPIEVYLACIKILRTVEAKLRSMEDFEQKDRNNLRFYAALQLARSLTNEAIPSMTALRDIAGIDIEDVDIESAVSICRTQYDDMGGTDQIAKGKELRIRLTELFEPAAS